MPADAKCYPRHSWLAPRVAVRSSAIDGNGLFTQDEKRQGERGIVRGGRLLTDAALLALRLVTYSTASLDDGFNTLLDDNDRATYDNHPDWRRRDVQEQYSDHFSPFLNERIRRRQRNDGVRKHSETPS